MEAKGIDIGVLRVIGGPIERASSGETSQFAFSISDESKRLPIATKLNLVTPNVLIKG